MTALVLAAVTVPLGHGSLRALADVRFQWSWALVAAVALQALILFVVPDPGDLLGLHAPIHVTSYLLIGIFVVRNLRTTGVWVIALGGLCNAITIVANGGVMYASSSALKSVGLYPLPDGFLNSTTLPDPKLPWMGDVIPIVPLHTVISLGDVLIAIGGFLLIHGMSGSVLVPRWMRRRPDAEAHGESPRPGSQSEPSRSGRRRVSLDGRGP